MDNKNPKVVVVIVPLPAQGHLNQLLHLSNLITTYGIPVHYAGSSTHNRQAKVRLNGWDPQSLTNIHFNDFELPPYDSTVKDSFLVSNVLRVGLTVKDWEHRYEIVKSSTIENAVKSLMALEEGKEIKERATELGEALRGSVGEGGVSRLERDDFIAHITR